MAKAFNAKLETERFHQAAASAVELSNANYDPRTRLLSVERSVRNWELGKRQTYLYHIPLDCDSMPPPTLQDSTIMSRWVAPSGSRMVIAKKIEASETSIILEVWEGASLIHVIEPTHGPVLFEDVTFGSPSFSNDETFVVYPAERKKMDTRSFWASDGNSKKESKAGDDAGLGATNVLGKGVEDDWGERYPNQAALTDLCILNLKTGRIGKIKNVPQGSDDENKGSTLGSVSLGQPVVNPLDQTEIAYTGFDAGGLGEMPRRLGMVFCRNRASQVYVSNIKKLLQELAEDKSDDTTDSPDHGHLSVTSSLSLARSPQYLILEDCSAALICLGNTKNFLSHDGCMGLYRCKEGSSIEEIIPPLGKPKDDGVTVPASHGIGFPGLFLGNLPSQKLSNGKGTNSVVLSTLWGSMTRVVHINVLTGETGVLESKSTHPYSSQILLQRLSEQEILVSEACSNAPAKIWKISLPSGSQEEPDAKVVASFEPIACTRFSSVQPLSPTCFDFDVKVLSISPEKIEGATDEDMQAILLLPNHASAESKVPLIVLPHGGPHSASTTSFVPGVAYMAQRYAVVLPNYRGSTGFGQESLESLLTRIGHVDISDVMTCTKHVLSNFADVIDAEKVGICGGSHGGFLTAHATSQYPDFFRAAVMRNPVTNIATMVTATDIPDWTYVEACGSYDFKNFKGPTIEEIQMMYERSPVSKVGDVTTPTLVALGMKDLRVPPSQGKEWYYSLRSRGVPVELLIYPEDNHALSLVCTESDHWLQIGKWFQKYFSEAP